MGAMTLPLTQESIATLVREFYDGVRADPELGPGFDAAMVASRIAQSLQYGFFGQVHFS